jgi:hypothetical protein
MCRPIDTRRWIVPKTARRDFPPQISGVSVTAKGEVRVSLAQKLALFDPKLHGGEAMATTRAGNEAL